MFLFGGQCTCAINSINKCQIMLFNFRRTDMEFLEVLTEGLNRVLLVRGGGREVITIYSWGAKLIHQIIVTPRPSLHRRTPQSPLPTPWAITPQHISDDFALHSLRPLKRHQLSRCHFFHILSYLIFLCSYWFISHFNSLTELVFIKHFNNSRMTDKTMSSGDTQPTTVIHIMKFNEKIP